MLIKEKVGAFKSKELRIVCVFRSNRHLVPTNRQVILNIRHPLN